MLNVKVHDNISGKRKGCRRKHLLSKRNMATQLRFVKLHLNERRDFWNNVLRTDKINMVYFGVK